MVFYIVSHKVHHNEPMTPQEFLFSFTEINPFLQQKFHCREIFVEQLQPVAGQRGKRHRKQERLV